MIKKIYNLIMTTDFLFAKQTFTRGAANLGNLSGKIIFNSSDSEEEADFKALYSDWSMVGDDIRKAISEYSIKN